MRPRSACLLRYSAFVKSSNSPPPSPSPSSWYNTPSYKHLLRLFGLSVDDVTSGLPTHDLRRRILATDSLASVEGFRVMIELTLRHLFGMNYCADCPECHCTSSPCQDLFGSSARAEGGIFGRVDAVFTSIEAQKATGSLHAHSQVFVQCLHQHHPLWDVAKKLDTDGESGDGGQIFDEYLN